MMNQRIQITCITLTIFSIAGCASRKTFVKDMFLLEARHRDTAVRSTSQAVLAVRPFSIAPAFQEAGLISRVGENQYQSDFYNGYFVSPARMITDQTKNWLSESGLFAQVLSPLSSVQPTYLLEGHIGQMFMDTSDAIHLRTVMEITFFLIEPNKRDETVKFCKTYRSVQTVKRSDAKDHVAAQNAGLRDILENLEKDLADYL